ncbi:MAG: hypothetical protein K1X89_06865 [Myxococcaceae bacterium]|nr:hypothetical protein [Myxococcaceae bacterium]
MRWFVLAALAWVACSKPKAAAPDAGSVATVEPVAVVDAGVPEVGIGLGGPTTGVVGGSGNFSCPEPAVPAPSPCTTATRLVGMPAEPFERLLVSVATANSWSTSESATVVRPRDVKVWLVGPTDGGSEVLLSYDSDTSGSYRDTRGGGTPMATGVSHQCVRVEVVAKLPRGVAVVTPECLPGLGRIQRAWRAGK